MALTRSSLIEKVGRRVLGVSSTVFRDLAAARHGATEEFERSWLSFEPVANTLCESMYLTLAEDRFDLLVPALDQVEPELRGIAYEGAGMGLALLDATLPWRHRLQAFVDGPGAPYRHLVYIGAGIVLPRMPHDRQRYIAQYDPLLRWFVIDGFGFYKGYMAPGRTVDEHVIPSRLRGYSRRAFDQGVGRSLWFGTGADVARIEREIGRYAPHRQKDLWSGIGLACAYAADVVDQTAIEGLMTAADEHVPDLAVGMAMASVVRKETQHPAVHTALACGVVWKRDSLDVAEVAARAQQDLPADGLDPAYEIWRRRIRNAYVELMAEP